MKRWPILVLAGCVAAFVFGVLQLFKLRFESGDVYPEYSSLRSDPLGTMALYESLEQLHPVQVKRDFAADNRLPDGKGITYLHLSASPWEWAEMSEETLAEVERFVRAGGRLGITFFPETSGAGWAWSASPPAPGGKTVRKSNRAQQPMPRQKLLAARWGIEFGLVSFSSQEAISNAAPVLNQSRLNLPGQLNWHSAMVFTNLDPAWEAIYARGTNAVVVQRRFGLGTVVLASDSYFLSNEALARDRHADLLAWFIGNAREVVFDEAHLGIVESSNVTSLMRKYRLHSVAAGFLVLALLFIWKNSSPFAPPAPTPANETAVLGRQVADGFVNLLRRNIPPRDLLTTCFEEWTKSLGRGNSYSISRVDQAQSVVEGENARAQTNRNPVLAYREICRVLKGDKPDAKARGGTGGSFGQEL